MPRGLSRRDFIKVGGGALALASLGFGGFIASAKESSPSKAGAPTSRRPGERDVDWAFVVDANKCIGCGKCVVACKLENKVPWEAEYYRTWVERYVISQDGEIFVDSPNAGRDGFQAEYMNVKYRNLETRKSFFVPKLCNQCDKPPCVQVCPTGASYMTKDGVILINRNICIGCKYCIVACPYGARFMLPEGVADKCTWCYHRITNGLLPACVEVCPVGARIFGDLREQESPVRKILGEKTVGVLKASLGTEPKVYYIGLEKGVR